MTVLIEGSTEPEIPELMVNTLLPVDRPTGSLGRTVLADNGGEPFRGTPSTDGTVGAEARR